MRTNRATNSAFLSVIMTVIAFIGCLPAQACADLYTIDVTADAFVEGGGSGDTNYGTDDKLYMGNEDAPDMSLEKARKVYLRFDVSSLSTVGSASLELTLEADAPSTTETIDLYGINNGVTGEDSWSESALTWNNAPGNDTSSFFELTTDATLLASFTVPAASSSQGDTFQVSDPDLASFLNSDTNGWVTFVLTASRRGTSSNPYDLFTFAAHEHGTYSGPSLIASTPEPTSLALMGIAMLGMILIRFRAVLRDCPETRIDFAACGAGSITSSFHRQ